MPLPVSWRNKNANMADRSSDRVEGANSRESERSTVGAARGRDRDGGLAAMDGRKKQREEDRQRFRDKRREGRGRVKGKGSYLVVSQLANFQ